MSKMKIKKKFKKYNVEEENSSQLELTWRIYNPWHEMKIKKNEFQKNDLPKNQKFNKKNIKKPELTWANFTNPLSK
jgi:hypothetical protein